MPFNPNVSIIIPVYNGANYMQEAIDSALAQTYKNIEIIVVNDGSTDDTEEIALSYGNQIRYFKKENGGQSSALNYGIENMTGEYFSWLSHDDVYYPHKIEAQVNFLANLSDKEAIVYSNYDLIDKDSKIIKKKFFLIHEPVKMAWVLMTASSPNGCTLLIPKAAFDKVGIFNVSRPHTSDVELFFDLSFFYPYYYLDESLIQSRVHANQMTHKKAKYHNYESNLFLIDTLEKTEKKTWAEISDQLSAYEFYKYLMMNWSKRGYLQAFLQAYGKLKKLEKYSVRNWGLITYCYFQYVMKRVKLSLKKII